MTRFFGISKDAVGSQIAISYNTVSFVKKAALYCKNNAKFVFAIEPKFAMIYLNLFKVTITPSFFHLGFMDIIKNSFSSSKV